MEMVCKTKVRVLQIDGDNTSLSGEAIRNVSYYHSIKYFEEYMHLWRHLRLVKV